MRPYIRAIMCITILLFGCSSGQMKADMYDVHATKSNDIELLIEHMGGRTMIKQIFDEVENKFTEYVKQQDPDIDDHMLLAINEETGKVLIENIDYFIALQIKIYDKYFTHSEIRDLISFYRSDTGRKYVKNMPAITAETIEFTIKFQEYIQPILFQRIVSRFNKEGYELEL